MERYDPGYAARLAADPELVSTLSDHPILYGCPDAFARLSFLRPEGPRLSLAEVTAGLDWPTHDDLAADLATLVGRYLASGLDVIAVDTTPPEAAGMAAAKVTVPGAVPLTFGHRYRRVHGLPRLRSLPRRLGYRDTDLRTDDLNPYPHPFP